MNLQDSEFVSFEDEFKKKKDGSISVRGLLNIYTDEGTFDAELIVNCKPKNRGGE